MDTEPTLREQSRQLLNNLDEKHHSFVLQKAAEGVRLSYKFRAALLSTWNFFFFWLSFGGVRVL